MTLVDKTLSDITDELQNPSDGNRLHVIIKVGSEWKSYYIELATLKSWVNTGGSTGTGLKVTNVIMLGGAPSSYIPEKNEQVLYVIFHPSTEGVDTFKMGTELDDEYYIPTTGNVSNSPGVFLKAGNVVIFKSDFVDNLNSVNVISIENI